MKQSIEQKLLGLVKHRNTLAPINKLPAELSLEVLRMSAGHPLGTLFEHNLRSLSRVQSRWWREISSCAYFWTHLWVGDPIKVTELKVQRSLNAPLDLRFHGGATKEQVTKFVSLVMPHSHRWQNLSFVGDEMDQLLPFLEAEAPLLEELVLEEYGLHRTLRFVGGSRLRLVQLVRTNLEDWGALGTSLTDLHIEDVAVPATFAPKLLQVLHINPHLTSVFLDDLKQTNAEAALVSTTPIALPYLTHLHLAHIPFRLALILLSNIQAEDIDDLWIEHGEFEGELLLHELVRPRGDGQGRLTKVFMTAGIDVVSLNADGTRFYVEGSTGQDLRLQVNLVIPRESLLQYGPSFPFARPEYKGTLRFAWKNPPGFGDGGESELAIGLNELLDLFPGITDFELASRPERAIQALRCLRSPAVAEENRWYCPKLERIVLWPAGISALPSDEAWSEIMEEVARTVEVRRGSGVLPVRSAQHCTPRRLSDTASGRSSVRLKVGSHYGCEKLPPPSWLIIPYTTCPYRHRRVLKSA